MYTNHNLRSSLQEWKNRLYRAPWEQFGHQFKYFRDNLTKHKQLAALLSEAIVRYPWSREEYDQFDNYYNNSQPTFESPEHHAAFCIQLIDYAIPEHGYNFHRLSWFHGSQFHETRDNVIEQIVSPIIYYLHDKLDESNSTLYLLEKYKRRTEWFTCAELTLKYNALTASYEDFLGEDLRLFLFDQGIDYPFSTPKSSSGRADIVGAIDTSDPIVIEVKLLDKAKGYDKKRIISGLSQAIKYCNDYDKNVGYIVTYNFDPVEINFIMEEKSNTFPPVILFNNKRFYFVTINMNRETTASKVGKTASIEITENELISNIS